MFPLDVAAHALCDPGQATPHSEPQHFFLVSKRGRCGPPIDSSSKQFQEAAFLSTRALAQASPLSPFRSAEGPRPLLRPPLAPQAPSPKGSQTQGRGPILTSQPAAAAPWPWPSLLLRGEQVALVPDGPGAEFTSHFLWPPAFQSQAVVWESPGATLGRTHPCLSGWRRRLLLHSLGPYFLLPSPTPQHASSMPLGKRLCSGVRLLLEFVDLGPGFLDAKSMPLAPREGSAMRNLWILGPSQSPVVAPQSTGQCQNGSSVCVLL